MKDRIESIDSKLQQVVEAELDALDKMQYSLFVSATLIVTFSAGSLISYLVNWSF